MSKRLALLIGNTEFDDAESFRKLRTPENDVHDLAAVLEEHGDFEIIDKLLDRDVETIRFAIEGLYARAERGDLTLLYYSGHGYTGRDRNLCLAARNTRVDRLLSTALRESFVRDAMHQSRSRHHVVILDCCFSGAFISGQKGSDDRLLMETLKGEATAILASSGRIQYSFEEKGRNSLFTQHLIAGIRTGQADANKDGEITIGELYNFAERWVRETRPDQTPMMALSVRESEIVIAKGFESPSTKIFISHASPQDRYFATWLASKLSLAGYDVWCEAGQPQREESEYWHDIEQLIGLESAKFLFVMTHYSIQNDSSLKEIAIADSLSRQENFIVPLKLDDVSAEDVPPAILKLEAMDFHGNWAAGLRQLTDRLERDNTPRLQEDPYDRAIAFWKSNPSTGTNELLNREEGYWTNWFEFTLPKYIYLHKFDQLKALDLASFPYPVLRDKDCYLSFACGKCFQGFGSIRQTQRVETASFLAGRDYHLPNTRQSIKDTNRKTIRLLNDAFRRLLTNKGLKRYQLSQGECFYFSSNVLGGPPSLKVDLQRYGRRSIQLSGKFRGFSWHFAVEGNAFFYPIHAYFTTYHVVFTKNGQIVSKAKQHSLRRRLGKDWYNKKWRDLTLGTMLWLSEGQANEVIEITVDCQQSIEIESSPIKLTSPVGYLEPVKGDQ